MSGGDPGGASLRISQLSKTYQGYEAVTDVNIEIRHGEVTALLGPNGAGKTTLLSMIVGITTPDSGRIEIDDFDVTALPIYARARLGLSYLPQESSVFRGLSVEDNIMLYLETSEPNRRQRNLRLETLLEEFGLTAIRKRNASKLSGGQRRRCEIARAIASDPDFVLLDEPFAGVDPLAIADLQQTIQALTTRDIGVLISDHNVRETLFISDRAYVLVSGRIIAEGTPQAIIADENVRRFYLGNSLDH